jgi:hypothetical protein
MKPRLNGRLVSVRNAADELGLAYHKRLHIREIE